MGIRPKFVKVPKPLGKGVWLRRYSVSAPGCNVSGCPNKIMPTPPKKLVLRKLRNGPHRLIDNQVLLWRKRMKKKGLKLGKGMEYAEREAEQKREGEALRKAGGIKSRRFFE